MHAFSNQMLHLNFFFSEGYFEFVSIAQVDVLIQAAYFSSVDDFLQKIASIHGKLKKGGVADTIEDAKIVLHEWNEGI